MKERATVICIREGQILYVRKPKAKWTLPGGRIESGETPAQAAARELSEETGMAVNGLVFVAEFKKDDVLHHLFEAWLPGSEHPNPQNEIADCKWVSEKELAGLKISDSIKSLVKAFMRRPAY